jgi:hypothetical protein
MGLTLRELILKELTFQGAKNLSIDRLSKVKTLYNTKLDPELEKPLRESTLPFLKNQ